MSIRAHVRGPSEELLHTPSAGTLKKNKYAHPPNIHTAIHTHPLLTITHVCTLFSAIINIPHDHHLHLWPLGSPLLGATHCNPKQLAKTAE